MFLIKNLSKKLTGSHYVRDVGRVFSGNVVSQLIGLLALPVLTRLYVPSDFALYNLFVLALGFVGVLASFRYEYLLPLSQDAHDVDLLMKLVIFLSVTSFLILTPLAFFSKDLVARALGDVMIAPYLLLLPLVGSLTAIGQGFQGGAQRELAYTLSSTAEVVSRCAFVIVALLGSWMLAGAWGLVTGLTVAAVMKISILLAVGGPKQRFNEMDGPAAVQLKAIARRFSHLAGSMTVSHALMSVTAVLPASYVAYAYGAATLGQYSLVTTTLFLPSALIGNAVGQVYYQRAAAMWASGTHFRGLWFSTAKIQAALGIPLFIFVALIAPLVYPIVFGGDWQAAGYFAVFLVPAAFLSFLTSPSDRGCLVVGAWRYVIGWHGMRLLTTGCVIGLSAMLCWPIEIFLGTLAFQMSFCYLLDFFAGYKFSGRLPVIKTAGALH